MLCIDHISCINCGCDELHSYLQHSANSKDIAKNTYKQLGRHKVFFVDHFCYCSLEYVSAELKASSHC